MSGTNRETRTYNVGDHVWWAWMYFDDDHKVCGNVKPGKVLEDYGHGCVLDVQGSSTREYIYKTHLFADLDEFYSEVSERLDDGKRTLVSLIANASRNQSSM